MDKMILYMNVEIKKYKCNKKSCNEDIWTYKRVYIFCYSFFCMADRISGSVVPAVLIV